MIQQSVQIQTYQVMNVTTYQVTEVFQAYMDLVRHFTGLRIQHQGMLQIALMIYFTLVFYERHGLIHTIVGPDCWVCLLMLQAYSHTKMIEKIIVPQLSSLVASVRLMTQTNACTGGVSAF